MTTIVILLIINIFRDKDAHTSVVTMGIQDVILVTFGTSVYTRANQHLIPIAIYFIFYGKCHIDLAV